jgi:ABC-type sugar transport system permease subunit
MLCWRGSSPGSIVGMQKSVWTVVLKTVIILVLIVSLLASAYGLLALGYDLLVEYDEWDGFGIFVGIVLLAVALPVMVTCLVSLRALKHRS